MTQRPKKLPRVGSSTVPKAYEPKQVPLFDAQQLKEAAKLNRKNKKWTT